MDNVARMATALQQVFLVDADLLARDCGVIKRQRKLSGSSLAQSLVFGWLGNPEATLEDLAHQAAVAGTPVTAQSLEERFTPALATFFQRLLARAAEQVVSAEPIAPALLPRT